MIHTYEIYRIVGEERKFYPIENKFPWVRSVVDVMIKILFSKIYNCGLTDSIKAL